MNPSTRRQLAFVAWFLLGCAGAVSLGAYHYPAPFVVILGGIWAAAAILSVWASPRHRTISLVIVLVTSIAMRRAFLQMIWAVEVVRGHIK